MKNLSEKIVEKIKNEKIIPKAKWKFVLKNSFYWILAIVFLVFVSLSVSYFSFLIKKSDFDVSFKLCDYFFCSLMILIPLFWLCVLFAFAVFSFINYRLTEKGYKLNQFLVLGGSGLLALIIGFVVLYSGFSNWMDLQIENSIPAYKEFNLKQKMLWMNPERGFLVGKVVLVNDDFHFEMKDLNNKKWLVDYRNAKVPRNFMAFPNLEVKILGKVVVSHENRFNAFEIRQFACDHCRQKNFFERKMMNNAY